MHPEYIARARQPYTAMDVHRRWSKAVRTRDGYTCQGCGVAKGRMNAHHMERVTDRPDLALDVANGLTLCDLCHAAAHVELGHTVARQRRERRICPVCGKAFLTFPSDAVRCCSRLCGFRHSSLVQKTRRLVQCSRCGKFVERHPSHTGTRVFCSTACRTTAPRRPCLVCGQMFKPIAQQVERGQGQYCGRACMGIAQCGPHNPNYRHGEYVSSEQESRSPRDTTPSHLPRWHQLTLLG